MRTWKAGNETMVEEAGRWTLWLEATPVVFYFSSWLVKTWFTRHGLAVPPELFQARPAPTPQAVHEGDAAWL